MSKVTAVAFSKKERGFKHVEWIPIKQLSVVWSQSQRALNERHAQHIADNFDPEMFGTLSVTLPNGSGIYHLIDGHHRKVAVERLWGEEERVPCQVYDAHDPARAAELFDNLNTARRAPSPLDIFRVRVTAKNEIEVAINRIVHACGYIIGHKGENSKANNIGCVGALKGIYSSYGGDVLKNALDLITAIWGQEDRTALDATIVRGVAEFLSEYRHVDWKRLREVISHKYTASRLHGAAKSYKELHGGTMPGAIKALIVSTYNQGQRPTKKLVKMPVVMT